MELLLSVQRSELNREIEERATNLSRDSRSLKSLSLVQSVPLYVGSRFPNVSIMLGSLLRQQKFYAKTRVSATIDDETIRVSATCSAV